ncbi:S8 family serine peptidase [Actinoallomurus purpureus]|uniref:S8 family serine peptidase n=1 Tax=Actinoallomurus purpureus TaxID=478114 RepID=UPI002092A79D|nr:S8 family serine peptidase [Actinoallomurus purpureus]MCO6008516.1 S8 family serine peptidase [Actinoallomurus purpureus]
MTPQPRPPGPHRTHPQPGTAPTPWLRGLFPAEAVAGVTELWRHTRGDPAITIGVYDGPPETTHPFLTGADVHTRTPWWLPPALADPKMVEHGTYTASVLFGQPDSPLPGLAPHCRGLFLAAPGDEDTPPDPLNAARAIDELLDAGADIIQFIPAYHTASRDADDLFKRAVARAIAAGVLITAPAGNDYGRCGIAPAILPGVLAVGARRLNGEMYKFSNWGIPYHGHGIVAPGGDVLGALPGGGVKAQKGTCVAVSLVTGAAALLLSLQRHTGHPANPTAVRDALLRTARPCTPGQSHGQPERCLNGTLDLPAATHLILSTRKTRSDQA